MPNFSRPFPRFVALSFALAACSSSSTPAMSGVDAGSQHDAGTPPKDTGTIPTKGDTGTLPGKADAKADGAGSTATMTIAAARMGNVTTTITVKGFVTALSGVPMDYPQWYIEDPAGGEYSGVDVYCDSKVSTPCNVPDPALHDLIEVTGTLTTYKGQVELEPTSMTVLQSNATPPPVVTLTAADVAPGFNSPYRGVYVKLAIPTKLTVDSVTPSALADTGCSAVFPVDGGTTDAGLPTCSPYPCSPPVYSGFQANDGAGNEIYIEAPFFNTDPLQSSPECLTQTGVVPVTVGTTFSEMMGILDFDGYANSQALSPVQPSDYTTP